MRFTDTHYEEPFYSSEDFDFYFGDARVGVFDIETTGLGPARAEIVLGGILTPTVGGVRVRQYFSEDPREERDLLDRYAESLSEQDVLFSYNGARFDVPFTEARLSRHDRPSPFGACLHMDLYHIVRRHTALRAALPNLKQKTVEDYMGLWSERSDRISGAESVYLYYEYLRNKSETSAARILLHNSDDVRQLARLLSVFAETDIHAVCAKTGFPVRVGERVLFADEIALRRQCVEVNGRHSGVSLDYVTFDETGRADFRKNGTFHVSVPCVNTERLILADPDELGLESPALRAHPCCRHGYLVLSQDGRICHEALNRLVKCALTAMTNKLASV